MMRITTAWCWQAVVGGRAFMGLVGAMAVLAVCAPTVMIPVKDRASLVNQVSPIGATTVPIQVVLGGIVLVPAEVDGHQGVFLLDTGGPAILLNTEYLQLTPAGSIDTNAARITDTLVPSRGVHHTWEMDSLLVRIGTLTMPQYAPVTVMPMFPEGGDWFVEARIGSLLDTLQLDTGNDRDELNIQTQRRIASHLRATGHWNVIDGNREPGVAIDQLTLAGRSFAEVPFYVSQRQSCLGGEFFWRNVGVIGLNFRGRRLIFYR